VDTTTASGTSYGWHGALDCLPDETHALGLVPACSERRLLEAASKKSYCCRPWRSLRVLLVTDGNYSSSIRLSGLSRCFPRLDQVSSWVDSILQHSSVDLAAFAAWRSKRHPRGWQRRMKAVHKHLSAPIRPCLLDDSSPASPSVLQGYPALLSKMAARRQLNPNFMMKISRTAAALLLLCHLSWCLQQLSHPAAAGGGGGGLSGLLVGVKALEVGCAQAFTAAGCVCPC
jgi:hypothetical protein